MKPIFKIHPSSAGKIMAGDIGLTETQVNRKFELITRKAGVAEGNKAFKPLTPNMESELALLIKKETNPELPAGAKSFCQLWIMEHIYGRRKIFTSKYTERGDLSEAQSLETIREIFGYNELPKNKRILENEYMIGTPDAIADDCIIDAKSPWAWDTFPLLAGTECPEKDYYYQAQCYFELVDLLGERKELFRLVYILNDMPEPLVIHEAKNWCFKNGEQFRPEVVDEMRAQLTYAGIDAKYKQKVFEIQRDDAVISQIVERVDMCRKYIATFEGFEN